MPLDLLKQKAASTEMRMNEAQIKKMEADTKLQASLAQKAMEFSAKTAQQRVAETVNPVVLAQVKSELTAAGLGNMPFGAFDGLAEQEARKRPNGVQHWFQTSPNNWEPAFVGGEKDGGVDKKFEAEMKHYETDHKVWLAHQQAYDRAFRTERDRVDRENAKAAAEGKGVRRATDQEIDDAAEKRVRMEPPGDEPLPPSRGGSAGGDSGGTDRRSKADAPPSKAPPPGKEVGSAIEVLQRGGVKLAEREDLPTGAKQTAAVILNEGQRMLEEAGGYDRMSPEMKKRYDQLVAAYAAATKPQPVPGRMLNADQLTPAPRMMPELSQQGPRRR
jgi:hypothetical protein